MRRGGRCRPPAPPPHAAPPARAGAETDSILCDVFVRVALSHDLLRQRGAAHGPFRPPGVVLARVEELSSRRRSETPLGDRLRLRKAASMKEMAAQGQAGGLLGKGGPLGIGALDSPTE